MTTRRFTLLLIGVVFGGAAAAAPRPRELALAAFAQPDRLVVLKETHLPEVSKLFVSPAMFRAWRERATSFQSLAALVPETNNLVGMGDPLRVSTALVSVDLFATLGVAPALGRDFVAGDEAPGKPDVAILGHAFWHDRFGGRADALGRTLALDGRPVTIISERAAKRWPAGVDPLGKRIKLYGGSRWLEVVGIVGEVSAGERGRVETQVYQPFAQEPVGRLSVVLRADAAQATLADGVRAALGAIDPAQSASEPGPVSDTIIQTVAPR